MHIAAHLHIVLWPVAVKGYRLILENITEEYSYSNLRTQFRGMNGGNKNDY